MTSSPFLSSAVASILFIGTAACVSAQANPDSVKRRNDCRLAMQVIEKGEPAPKRDWAHSIAGLCDPSARQAATLAAMTRLRTSHDRSQVGAALSTLIYLRDGKLFAAVIDLTGDGGASVEARVWAFVVLERLFMPTRYGSYADFAGGIDARGFPLGRCAGVRAHDDRTEPGVVPMPADFRGQIAAAAARVLKDTAAPPIVRGAAGCIG